MADKTSVFTFDDFSGGEFGEIPPDKAGSTQWTGDNCVVYRNGEIGPRPGLKAFTNLGLNVGTVLEAGFSAVDGTAHWLLNKDNIWVYDSGTTAWVKTISPNITPSGTPPVFQKSVHNRTTLRTYLPNDFGSLYSLIDYGSASELTQVASFDAAVLPASGKASNQVSVYRNRLYVSGYRRVTTTPVTIFVGAVYYSDPDDFDTWSTTGFFNVGTEGVAFLGWDGDALVIIDTSSAVWEYRGVPGSDSLRRTLRGSPGLRQFSQDRAHALPSGGIILFQTDTDYPSFYQNGQLTELVHLRINSGEEPNYPLFGTKNLIGILDTGKQDDLLILYNHLEIPSTNYRAFRQHNGTWSFFTWGIADLSTRASSDNDGIIMLSAGGDDTTVPTMYTFDALLERPGFTSDDSAQPGDDTFVPLNAEFTTGQIWSKDGNLFEVEEIIIDFTKYETGQAETTHITIQTTMFAHGERDGQVISAYEAFDEPNTDASTDGLRDRHIARGVAGGPTRGAGVQVRLSDIRGCTIRAITLKLSSDEGTELVQPE